jgi:glyoxylase-like metal-dependent hydrolase (beta-lactamase superfamily II)
MSMPQSYSIATRKLSRTLLALTLCGLGTAALAAAPQVKTQPGYYRVMVGSIEVTALSDGTLNLQPEKLLSGRTAEQIAADLAAAHISQPVVTSMNAYLVNTGSKLVLIDSGGGSRMGADGARLLQSLKNAGYTPEQVDEIYVTHLHGDHIGGLSANGQRNFPNAVLRLAKAEAGFWLDEATAAAAPEANRGSFKNAVDAVAPYRSAGKLQTFDGTGELVPGIRSIAVVGHTIGHSNYLIESEGKKLQIIGDLIHVGAVQFPHPEVVISFDRDSKQAAADRRQVFDQAAKDGTLIGAAHLSFPGLGYINAEGSGYRWLPVNYGPAK